MESKSKKAKKKENLSEVLNMENQYISLVKQKKSQKDERVMDTNEQLGKRWSMFILMQR